MGETDVVPPLDQPGLTLVTGATGNIGRGLVPRLVELGAPVRVLTRQIDEVARLQGLGIEAVRGGFDDDRTLREAFQDCAQVFLLPPPGRDQLAHHRRAIDAAVAAGVQRVVQLSTLDANPDSAIPWAAAHARADVHLAASGLRWTLLKPSAYMQNLLEVAGPVRRGVLPQTSGRGGTGWIDTADISEVAARVLTEDGHDGRKYRLTGPAVLSAAEIAETFSRTSDHRVRYLHLPAPVFYLALRLSGSSHWEANGLVHQFVDVVRRGQDDGAILTDDVLTVTGRPPKTLEAFAREHADDFARRPVPAA